MIHRTKSRIAFEIFNYILISFIGLILIIPFIHIIAISFSSKEEVVRGAVRLIPRGFSLEGYHAIISNLHFWQTFFNSVWLTVLNTILSLLVSILAAYALSSKHFIGKNIFITYILIPMYFYAGLIPFYITVDSYKLTNSYLAIILPVIANTFQIIIIKNNIEQLPIDLIHSAEIDGAGDFLILLRIILPLILPMVAAFIIISASNYWNEWFNVLIFIRDRNKWTLQFKLRELITISELSDMKNIATGYSRTGRIYPTILKMSAIIVAIVPIVAIYPFMQKYFIHGIIVGAVKG